MKNRLLWIVVALIIVAAGAIWFFTKRPTDVISADTTINGDYTVESGRRYLLKGGAALTVEGNLMVNGSMTCEDGPLRLVVKGDLVVNDELKCESNTAQNGIHIVAEQSLIIDGDAEIVSSGSVQFAESENLLADSEAELEALYQDAATGTGPGQRVGPLADEESVAMSAPVVRAFGARVKSGGFSLLPRAQATSHTVVIGGRFVIPTPPPGVRQIVVVNFPTAVGAELRNLEITGPDGRPGADDKGNSCTARGKDGDDAFRFLAYAGNITVNNFTLTMGGGGKGGDAETTKDCDPGIATGGKGGKGGNFKMIAGNQFRITGAFVVNPGKGGAGGAAIAHGKDGGPSEKGGDATATGGAGADNNKKLGIEGSVAGTENVQIGSLDGGPGADATANPGKGGDGLACKPGGPGGKGTATGGKGGDAKLTLAGSAVRAPGATDSGGDGGDAKTHGGNGGKGGDCPDGAGGNGGDGGSATAKFGIGGKAEVSGFDGGKLDETGGNGGNGGNGCPEGEGGKGGTGNPPGKDGTDGKKICPTSEEQSQTAPPDSEIDQPPVQDGGQTEGKVKVDVIQYQSKYIPIASQIHKEPGHTADPSRSCPEEHWHSFEGIVMTTDNAQVYEPADPCGFGYTSDHPVMQVEVAQ